MSKRIKNGQRGKLAVGFCAVFMVIVLANWWVSYSMTQVSSQFKSVHQDRLVLTLDIVAMQKRYYQNRMLLEEHLQAALPAQQQHIEEGLKQHIDEIDSLTSKFRATYFTNEKTEDSNSIAER